MNVLGLAVLIAQFGIPHLPSVPPIPSVPGLPNAPGLPSSVPLPPLVKAPPLTIEMVPANPLRQIPELDAFVPEQFAALADVPRTADGSFELVPGAFELIDQSFCLRAGAHGPTPSTAYLAGSLGGTRVAYVSTVLAQWRFHPEFAQGDVQSLLWGITSQTKISQLSAHLRSVAAALLSPEQIAALNGDALGSATEFLAKYGGSLPAPMRDVLGTESQVRDLLTGGNASYAQLEALAVIVHPAKPDATRDRWSYDPRGFFIRYLPQNYTTTTIQLYVPPSYGVLRDAAGRVVRIVDDRGSRLDATYGPSDTVTLTYSAAITIASFGPLSARISLGTTALLPSAIASSDARLRAVDALTRTAEPLLAGRMPRLLDRHEALNFLRGAVPAGICIDLGGCSAARVASTSLVGLGPAQTLLDLYHSVAAALGFQPLGQSGKPAPADKSKDCAKVKEELAFAQEYRSRYSDPAITGPAERNDWDGQTFQNAVHDKAQGELGGASGGGSGNGANGGGSNGGGSGGGSTTGFSQGGETNLQACQSFIPTPEQVAAKGWPAIMYDAIKNHEDAHVAKCLNARTTGEIDDWRWRQSLEIDGYNHTIDTLNAWIAANC
jgi:uncharacterized membrane protein YgcG